MGSNLTEAFFLPVFLVTATVVFVLEGTVAALGATRVVIVADDFEVEDRRGKAGALAIFTAGVDL